jgi:hypothetical protein
MFSFDIIFKFSNYGNFIDQLKVIIYIVSFVIVFIYIWYGGYIQQMEKAENVEIDAWTKLSKASRKKVVVDTPWLNTYWYIVGASVVFVIFWIIRIFIDGTYRDNFNLKLEQSKTQP